MANSSYHIPVMLGECMKGLKIKPNGVYVDVTFGGGGHSRKILEQLSDNGKLFAFDKDVDAERNLPEDDRLTFINQDFRYMKNFLRLHGVKLVDGILADLGVSSHQFDTAERGFSIRFDAELDMRMQKGSVLTAREVVNTYSEERLYQLFKIYGELKNALSVARTIVSAREVSPIETVEELKKVTSKHAPRLGENKFYARLFQALRIEVNDELGALKDFLSQSVDVLKTGGRIVVMSYHSLEDRMVKQFFREGKVDGEADRDFYGNRLVPFKVVTRKPLVASDEEQEHNPRSRSAKLRIAERI
jgi:16S rRNA (cytosine1402-N4)-methyltransferase